MLDDTVVLFAQWMNGDIDPTASVNALLPNVARRSGDRAPPTIGAVYDEVRTEWIIQGNEPDVTPSLIVAANADVSLYSLGGLRGTATESEQSKSGGFSPLVIAVSYAVRQTDIGVSVTDSGYTLKAIRQSIGRLHGAPIAQRTLNNTVLLDTRQITERRLVASKGNSALMGVVLAVCVVRDLAP